MKITSKSQDALPAGSSWRWIPIPDTAQISGGRLAKTWWDGGTESRKPAFYLKPWLGSGGEGLCSWDAVESFSSSTVEQHFREDFGDTSLCDAGPKVHNPNNWQAGHPLESLGHGSGA